MITNTSERDFDVIEITNEMPHNRMGGVGSVIEALASGFAAIGVRALWFVTDHEYQPYEVEAILASHPCVAVGSEAELANFSAPVVHIHSYNHGPGLLDATGGARSMFTIHSLLAYEEISNAVDLHGSVMDQERLIAACDEVVLVSEAERAYYHTLGYPRLNPRVSVVAKGIVPPAPVAIQPRRNVLGYCGRLVPRKHPEYVQMLLAEPGFDRFEAMIAGKAFSAYARDLVHDLGVEARARYLGWCGGARLEAFYNAVDVLVQPSTYEPFGLAALGGAARGIPVVCTPVDGLVEVLGEHAIYCDDTSYAAFCRALCRQDLKGLRADDRMYPRDRQVWTSVCVYMLCCKYGLAVLEDRVKDEFNPNVALEYGFMRALDKPTVLLADVGFRNLRADIVGTLREPFDIVDMTASLPTAIANWSRDLGVQIRAQPGDLPAQALKIHRRLLNIRCAQLLRDEGKKLKETNDEFWYLGEEIAAYRALLLRRPHAEHGAAVERTQQRLVEAHDFSILAEMIQVFADLAQNAS